VSLTLGSAAALTQWSADVVVLGDDLGGVAFALRAARRAFRVIRQNLGWALAYNAFAIPLAASGELSPVAAAIGMSASSLIVVGNAWRLARPGASAAERSGAHARQPRAASAAC
jgi:Cu2+-exporting ATPase